MSKTCSTVLLKPRMICYLTKRLKTPLRQKRSTEIAWPTLDKNTFRQSAEGLVVHGLHKSATMFLYQFFDELSGQLEILVFLIHKPAPYRELNIEAANRAFVLCPIRSLKTPTLPLPAEKRFHRLFHVRDPRDVLVSEYFSIG